MPAIGTYRIILAYSPQGLICGNRPIYGQRKQYLPIPQKNMNQVLVDAFGEKTWINVDETDVTLRNG